MKEGVGENVGPFSVSKSLKSFHCAKTDLPDFLVCQIKPDAAALFHLLCLCDHVYYNYLSPL